MAEYIERGALLRELETHFCKTEDGRKLYHPSMALAMKDVKNAPAVDVVEVVRCEDCEHWMRNRGIVDSPNGHCFYLDETMNEHDFCSYGEREESNEQK